MSKKFLIGLAPVLAVAAFALVPSAAMAGVEPCWVLTSAKVKPPVGTCNNPPGVLAPQNLRDNAFTPPAGGGFGTDALAVNTHAAIRFRAKISGVFVNNFSPAGYAFFGLKLVRNPLSPKTKVQEEKCEEEKGKPAIAE